ncbi:MAG: hypothetical protein LBL96_11135 [Clostridiales bacterium]|nr:hypothetical protein [Clostridiales bacterium]
MDTDKKMLLCLTALYVIVLAVGLMLNRALSFDTAPAYVTGLTMGTVFTAVKIVTLKLSIDHLKITPSHEERASSHAPDAEPGFGIFSSLSFVAQYMLRNVLSAAMLVFAIINPFVSVWGVAAGLLLMQFAAFGAKFWPQKGARHGL